ncbi:hypothetical protein [Cellulomonas fengjieae]|uniref:N-acetyltransferase domain-containing protein n=1 Tax=Cellulomonas fengjieae TaxID=2819978 RepID=A0ABS3SGL1_9CELL|nr:hypothetical protein [Cellulomonas fengjieae]MBO3084095.1 hypothetical protein [Cellulomonas fengjieae]QVI64650.1 hypothetical protein KG102_10680 [Cellulomonas fengjieae]
MTTEAYYFADGLPGCCATQQLRLRVRYLEMQLTTGHDHDAWAVGLDSWDMTVRVDLSDDEQLGEWRVALEEHLGRSLMSDAELDEALLDHGIGINGDRGARVADATFVVARFDDDTGAGADRPVISDGHSLALAADDAADDLIDTVAPIVGADEMFSDEICELFPDAAVSDALLILRTVRVAPVVRGNGIGAWAVARAVSALVGGATLVAAKAAPVSRRDAIPGIAHRNDLDEVEQRLWNAEQARLAEHWTRVLGFERLPSTPTLLVWHSVLTNRQLRRALSR